MKPDRRRRRGATEAQAGGPRADVAGLQAFVAVARLGTVGRAAERLGRTQPGISARLAALERSWGTRLFRREPRGMSLTPEGARLLPGAEAILRDLERLDEAAGVPPTPTRELRVGAGDALARELLPRAIGKLLREEPALDVRIREGPGPRLLEALRNGEIDLALVVRPPPTTRTDGVDLDPVLQSPVDVLVPRGHAGEHERVLSLKGLAGRRLVALQAGSGFRLHLEAAFASRGLSFRPAVEVGNLSLVRRFVAAGLGLGPVPRIAFDTPLPSAGVERRRLAGIPPVTYVRASRSGLPQPSTSLRLVELLTERG